MRSALAAEILMSTLPDSVAPSGVVQPHQTVRRSFVPSGMRVTPLTSPRRNGAPNTSRRLRKYKMAPSAVRSKLHAVRAESTPTKAWTSPDPPHKLCSGRACSTGLNRRPKADWLARNGVDFGPTPRVVIGQVPKSHGSSVCGICRPHRSVRLGLRC